MRLVFLPALMFLLCHVFATQAQTPEGLSQDAKGRYLFMHTATALDAPKEIMYDRMKSFIVEDLNASDTYIRWDEQGHDSVTTVAFIELGNSPEVINQVVDCKASLYFMEGSVGLVLSGFNYSGMRADGLASYGTPLHRMASVPDNAQSWAKIALTETLRQLAARMDALASGAPDKPKTVKQHSAKTHSKH